MNGAPEPPPGGWLKLQFPDRFRLDFKTEGEWMEWGSYERKHVFEVRGEENVWVAAAGGMPIYFRCVEKREGEFDSIAGTGERITYRFVELR